MEHLSSLYTEASISIVEDDYSRLVSPLEKPEAPINISISPVERSEGLGFIFKADPPSNNPGVIEIVVQMSDTNILGFEDVAIIKTDHWVRLGHGHGFEDVAEVSGYDLRSFLKSNFPAAGGADFFLFVACDGYRCLFSGREIFETDDGKGMLIATAINGRPAPQGFRLALTADFFADRSMWGLSHVVRIPDVR